MPSPLKSPTATESVAVPAVKFVAVPKLPAPSPNKIETTSPKSAMARSWLPSPLKSPTATDSGAKPLSKFVVAKPTGLDVAGVVTVSVNVLVWVAPLLSKSDGHHVSSRRVCVRYANDAARRIAFQRAVEISRCGNIDAPGVEQRCRIGDDPSVGTQRKRRVWIVSSVGVPTAVVCCVAIARLTTNARGKERFMDQN